MRKSPLFALLVAVLALLAPVCASAMDLDHVLGRRQLEIRSAPFAPVVGRTVEQQALRQRLERLDYARVRSRPTEPGTWQIDGDTWWVFRRGHRSEGRWHDPEVFGVVVQGGVVRGLVDRAGAPMDPRPGHWLEPEVLATSWDGGNAPRIDVRLSELPEAAWRPLLALEDHRFFEHSGVSGRAIARAALANVKKGGVAEGGSTITQQLVKNRDLAARRALDRKASEAVRALALEASTSKEEILEAYLNTVYYGHVDGVGVYGIGRASQVWFGKPASTLRLHEGALLAAILQGPNAMHPLRHPQRARQRRDKALDRMQQLGWATPEQVATAKARPLGVDVHPSPREATRQVLDRVRQVAEEDASRRLDKELGFEIDTTLDPWLQQRTVDHTRAWLDRLRRGHRRLRGKPLHAVVVVMDAESGDVLAYVGGDPSQTGDSFDRARRARRQPGSTLKPLILLEAYDDCGSERPIRPSTRISDGPVRIGDWSPRNHDGKHHGSPTAHDSLVHSHNRAMVRLAQHCDLDASFKRMRRAGLTLPDDPPAPALLGAVEVSPLELLQAHSAFANQGITARPRLVSRIGRPNGTRTGGESRSRRRIAQAGPTWLVSDALGDVVRRGTARGARLQGTQARGKTGTSSQGRDAWFVGHAEGRVTVVWVGLDEGVLGLSGGRAAAPLWKRVMQDAVDTAPDQPEDRPDGVVVCKVDPATGLAPGLMGDAGTVERWCLRRARPPRAQPWRKDEADRIR